MLEGLWIDLRLAIRAFRASPAFALVVVTTFAVAIGANTAMFSLLNAIVLRPIAARNPGALVSISAADERTNQPGFIYVDTFTAFRDRQQSFSQVAMYSGGGIIRIEAHGTAIDVGVEGVTAPYFDLLGARPAAGRLLTEVDQPASGAGPPVVVISDRLWRRLYGADSRAVGDAIKVDGRPMTIVGVTAPGLVGLQSDSGSDLFLPLATMRTIAGDPRRPIRALNVIARLAPGVTLRQARAEVVARWPAIQAATIPPSLSDAEQRSLRSQRVDVESAASGFSLLRRQYATSLEVLVGLTGILVAIGCANLTGLVLARAMRRQQQIAVRVALGASRGRLIQQLLVEGLVLALAGLAAALPLAWWSSRALGAMLSAGRTAPLRPMTPDARVLLVATGITIAAGLLVNLLPAWRASHATADSALRPGRSIVGSLGKPGRLLLVAQVALAMVLLVGAGLFVGTLRRLYANDQPFGGRPILWTRLWRIPGDRTTFGRPYWQELIRQLSAIRGVSAASLSFYFPAYLAYSGLLPTDSYASASDPAVAVAGLTERASPGLFATYGITRLRGRDFTWDDDGQAPPVAIVNESLASKLFPSGNAVGQHLRVQTGPPQSPVEIVGVVVDAPIGNIRDVHQAVVFRPLLQDAPPSVPIAHVRVNGNLAAVGDEYVRVVQSQGHHFVRGLSTLEEWTDYALLPERLIAGITTSAAVLAVLLGSIGIYGLLAYAVESRTREIGVRMALGATRATVVRMIARDGLAVVVAGVLLGVPCAIASARLVRSQLYGVTPTDLSILIGAAIIFLITGFVAVWLPARRASQLDPMDALRQP